MFKIDMQSGKPVFQQIIDEIRLSVASGKYLEGDKIPTIRELAAELRVNRNTVAKAYRELEQCGLITTRPGIGSIICDTASHIRKTEKKRILKEKIVDLLVEAYHLQVENKELIEWLEQEMEKMSNEKGGK